MRADTTSPYQQQYEMTRLPSDDQPPTPATGPQGASFAALSRGVSPVSRPVSAFDASRTFVVTPIAQLTSLGEGNASMALHDLPTPEHRPAKHRAASKPIPKPTPPTAKSHAVGAVSSSAKAAKPALDFAGFARTLPSAIDSGEVRLRLTSDGAGGTYFVIPRDSDTPVAVFKPAAQEIGELENPRGNQQQDERFELAFRPGEGYKREVLAFQLDHEGFCGVPDTVEVELQGERGSLQRYVPLMVQSWSTTPGKFDLSSVQRIAVFDIRTLNCDRHGGNLLVRRDAPELCVVPIDHGYILPDGWCEPDFEWALWPQSTQSVRSEIRNYVASLDADADAARVAQVLGEASAEVIAVTTRLLQVALRHGKQHTLRDIANFCRRTTSTQPCGLEELINASRADLDDGGELDMKSLMERLEIAFP